MIIIISRVFQKSDKHVFDVKRLRLMSDFLVNKQIYKQHTQIIVVIN